MTIAAGEQALAADVLALKATRQFFVPIQVGSGGLFSNTGTYARYRLDGAGDWIAMNFRVPADFLVLTSVKVLIIPITTGTFDWTATANFGADGQGYQTHNTLQSWDGEAGTNLVLKELNISALCALLAANDIVGLTFTLDALATMVAVDVLGLDVKYA